MITLSSYLLATRFVNMAMNVHWPFSSSARPLNTVTKGEGAYLYRADGTRLLDAAGGAVVTNIGHGRKEVADAVYQATLSCSYVVPPWLTPERERLLERLTRDWLPPHLTRHHLTCSGSEGVETAMKIALQYQAARGKPAKTAIIARTPSYHGTTLATAAASGHEARKRGLEQALAHYPSAPAPYPLRQPGSEADVVRHCLDALEAEILRVGADSVAALLAEPIVGASGGALVPPNGYWQGARELCDRHDMLLLADDVMAGFGRTGTPFSLDHWNVAADVLVAGKGLGGGYAPITGVFATEQVGAALDAAGMNVMFHTFAAHPAACAAADKVLEILTREDLVARAATIGAELKTRLADAFAQHPHVAEVRGSGLLLAVEIVADRDTLEPFPLADGVANRVVAAGLRRGVAFYPGGTGAVRDIVLIGAPFVIDESDVAQMVEVFVAAVDEVTGSVGA